MAWWDKLGNGKRVIRPAADLPAAAAANIFTIVGGTVMVTQILGIVTTVIQNIPCNLKLTGTPDTGTARDICANLNIQAYAEGDVLGITGINTDAMIPAASAGNIEGQTVPVILKAGTIDQETSAAPTGQIQWIVFYIPIDDGAYIVAA